MKKIIIFLKRMPVLLFVMAASIGAFGQDPIEKGSWMVTGGSNLGYTSVNPDNGTSSSLFVIDLKAGYFFMDNLAGGLLFDMVSASSGGSSSSITSIGVYGRYYVNGKIFFGLGIASASSSGGGSSSTQIPIEAGYAFFLSKVVAIEPSLKFTSMTGGSTFGLNLGFTVFLGRGD